MRQGRILAATTPQPRPGAPRALVHPMTDSDKPHCSACDAVCCRMTVALQPGDRVAEHLIDYTPEGLEVMARDEFGWCVAVDPAGGGCTIYHSRPEACRFFRMGGAHCIEARAEYADRNARGIPLRMY